MSQHVYESEARVHLEGRVETLEQRLASLEAGLRSEVGRLRNWDSKAINAQQAHDETADRLEALLQEEDSGCQ